MVNVKSIFKFWKGKDGKKPISASEDPVCGMTPAAGIDFIHEGINYSFCSNHCKQRFEKEPKVYISK